MMGQQTSKTYKTIDDYLKSLNKKENGLLIIRKPSKHILLA